MHQGQIDHLQVPQRIFRRNSYFTLHPRRRLRERAEARAVQHPVNAVHFFQHALHQNACVYL